MIQTWNITSIWHIANNSPLEVALPEITTVSMFCLQILCSIGCYLKTKTIWEE